LSWKFSRGAPPRK